MKPVDRKKHLDQKLIEAKKQALKDIAHYLEIGDEEGYVKTVKVLRPDITHDELLSKIEGFREERRRRAASGG